MRGNPESIFQPKLLGFVPELLQLVYEVELQPRSGSGIARRNALAPLCHRNNNSLCWDSRYPWGQHQQGHVENVSCQCRNSQQLRGSAVIHGFCLTWKQSLPVLPSTEIQLDTLEGDAHKTTCKKITVYLRSSHIIQLF